MASRESGEGACRKGLVLSRVIFILAAFVALLVLYGIASSLMGGISPKDDDIVGNKNRVLLLVSYLARECWLEHAGSDEAVVCEERKVSTTEEVPSTDIQNAILSRDYPSVPGPPCLGTIEEINSSTSRVIIQYSEGCIDVLAIRKI